MLVYWRVQTVDRYIFDGEFLDGFNLEAPSIWTVGTNLDLVIQGANFPSNVSWQQGISKVVSTHLWNTPLNIYQKAKEGFLS